MGRDLTSLQIPIPLNNRIKKLAETRKVEMGLSTLTRVAWLELIVKQEEERSGGSDSTQGGSKQPQRNAGA